MQLGMVKYLDMRLFDRIMAGVCKANLEATFSSLVMIGLSSNAEIRKTVDYSFSGSGSNVHVNIIVYLVFEQLK